LGLALVLPLHPSSARAWTEARVESASAWVDVLDEQRVRVSLELSVRVDGGWLTHLSLRGLAPSLSLDSDKPPYVLSEDGRKIAPTVRRDATGELVLGFPDRRTAPRRGRHRVGLVYEATLTTAGASGSAPGLGGASGAGGGGAAAGAAGSVSGGFIACLGAAPVLRLRPTRGIRCAGAVRSCAR
jgi:hypothetical protein